MARTGPLITLGRAALLLAAAGVSEPGLKAQQADLTLPPRLEEEPGSARLASVPADRAPVLEEVIVVSDTEWRLPDLGSTWRADREEEAEPQRIEVSFLPLYDPENRDPILDLFPETEEFRRIELIELFRVRFGRRSTDGTAPR